MIVALALLAAMVGCAEDTASTDGAGAASPTVEDATVQQSFPDVIDAELARSGEAWTLSATISSPYDSPERYADAFRALAPDGSELGVRVLTHDHANEQPFTRSLTGLVIPDGVEEITVEGRDLANGWGGRTVTVAVPG
ncbi:hypothetical protein [Euzebya rosea]|uniref:hypothetical protein n=1 Tax=Euzebya rosea TaxID=2052804 RepID=UPI001300734E|nr:hypothetical protein [Euzebya rosea]